MHTFDDIINYLSLSDLLATSGQPDRAQLANIRAAGYAVLVNLALPTSTNAIPEEGELVRGLGMSYIHIPVVWEAPTMEDLQTFFDTMDALAGQKVWVHCALNMRVSAFIFLYRVLRLGMAREAALADLQRIWEPEGVWQAFIEKALIKQR